MGAGISEENIKLSWNDIENWGFNSSDKSLTIVP